MIHDPNFTVHFVDTTIMFGCTISSSLSFTSARQIIIIPLLIYVKNAYIRKNIAYIIDNR